MPITRIWLARHAESATPTVFHGAESDVELGERGRAQAAVAVDHFRQLQLTLVVTSAMRRAIATAEPTIRALKLPHRVISEFHERRVGKLGGTSFDLSEGPWADTLREWQRGNTAFTTEGAESFEELQQRLVPAWRMLLNDHAGERVLLVAHGVVVKVLLLSLISEWGPKHWTNLGRVHNLAVTELECDEGTVQVRSLLTVPPAVAAISAGGSTTRTTKSEG